MQNKSEIGNRLVEVYLHEYMEKLFYFSLKRTGSRQEAEDLTSDISLCIVSQLQKGCVPERFSGWVWKIARNRYSRWAAEKHKRAEHGADGDGLDAIPDTTQIEADYIHREEVGLLRRELAFISSDYRNIVVAYYIEDTPIRTIANTLHLTEGAVKMRLSRVRNILKEGMSMAREFGIKSYRPGDVTFSASGFQPSGLPWSAVNRKIPKNILLQADNNPSTIEELAMELGISVPYMEEEVTLLCNATLLKTVGDKYVTNFFIASCECLMEVHDALRADSTERSSRIAALCTDVLPKLRALGIEPESMSDGDILWWLAIYATDMLRIKALGVSDVDEIANPAVRENGETWGFMGYERCETSENLGMGHCGNQRGFWAYQIPPYGMWERAGFMSPEETLLLRNALVNGRKVTSFTEEEAALWRKIDGIFAHTDGEGNILPDLLMFRDGIIEKAEAIIEESPHFAEALPLFRRATRDTVGILEKYSNEVLRKQLTFYAAMELSKIRTMTVTDLVEGGTLTVPANPSKSTVAMYMFL